jgi:flagellar hook-length control protein FliK
VALNTDNAETRRLLGADLAQLRHNLSEGGQEVSVTLGDGRNGTGLTGQGGGQPGPGGRSTTSATGGRAEDQAAGSTVPAPGAASRLRPAAASNLSSVDIRL